MSNQSLNTPIPSPVGPRSENLDWIAITIQPPAATPVDAPTAAAVPTPSNPLRVATENLNVTSHQIPPTGGSQMRRNSGKKKKNGTKESGSPSRSVKCRRCGQIGHIKKHCKAGSSADRGGTRTGKKKKLIDEALKAEAEQAAGAQDAAQEQAADARESVQPSSEEPEPGLPAHYSSLSSSVQNLQAERLQLDRVLYRSSHTAVKDTPFDAFQFWAIRFGLLYLIAVFAQIQVLGWWSFICFFSQAPLVYMSIHALWRDCVEKRWFYMGYLTANQIYANRVVVKGHVPSTFDEGPTTSTELRVDNHALKDAELKPYLHEVELWRANNKHWFLNLYAPEFFTLKPERLVISSTLLKHLIADIDVFYDTKQLLLKSQMQCLRNQRVAISAEDIAHYGDVYGNTALIATFHNERVNSTKRRTLDFLRSPARA